MISRNLIFVILLGVPLLINACATLPAEPTRPEKVQKTPLPTPPSPSAESKTGTPPAPRTIASLKLTEQAHALIESNAPDQAIRLLEKAIAIDPDNGRNYYFLAEAYLMKGDAKQARSFNRLAEIYLGKDADWTLKVKHQKARIEKE